MKVFVEFVLRLIFVDLKLSQNPYMPTTRIVPLELINSNRDTIRKAGESYLITIANTPESNGMSRRD